MAKKLSYLIVVVSEMPRSVQFYRDALGLTVRYESPTWTEFATGETSLVLLAQNAVPSTWPAEGRAGVGGCHFCILEDFLELYESEIGWKGIKPVQESKILDVGNRLSISPGSDGLMRGYNSGNPGLEGSLVSAFRDPDGLPVWTSDQMSLRYNDLPTR